MKLLRHGVDGAERPGILHVDGTIRDLTGLVPDISGAVLSDAGLAAIRAFDLARLPVVAHDVSERAFQTERSGQWTKGKSCDNFGQIGPWLVTRDEVSDPQDLALWLNVNGRTFQNGSTCTMVYGVAHLVSYLSQFMTLHPGDVISTGTPPGVGLGQKPPRYLKAGDVVELGIEGLGQQRQDVIADPA